MQHRSIGYRRLKHQRVTTDFIHWDAVSQVLKEVPRSRKIFIIKHTMGMCRVGKFMKLWGPREMDACPRCSNPEDAGHVWFCDQMGALDVWEKALLDLSQWMETVQTDPDIRDTIINNLRGWRSSSSPQPSKQGQSLLAFDQQTDIGWNVIL
jgi:hypothetical protein